MRRMMQLSVAALATVLFAKGDKKGARAAAEAALGIVPWHAWARWMMEKTK